MRQFRTMAEKMDQKIYCFGGGGGGGGGSSSPSLGFDEGDVGGVNVGGSAQSPNEFGGGGGNVFGGAGRALFSQKPNYTRTLPNGIEVVDFSTPFQGQANLSNQGSLPSGEMFGNAPTQAVRNPDVLAPITGTTAINPANFTNQTPLGMDTSMGAFGAQVNQFQQANTPVNPAQALQQALSTGRVQLGGGFYAGNTPSGMGLGFERTFAEGGAVQSPIQHGIGSLGLAGKMSRG